MLRITQDRRELLLKQSLSSTAKYVLSDAFVKGFITWNFLYSGTHQERLALGIMEHLLCPLANQMWKFEIPLETLT